MISINNYFSFTNEYLFQYMKQKLLLTELHG